MRSRTAPSSSSAVARLQSSHGPTYTCTASWRQSTRALPAPSPTPNEGNLHVSAPSPLPSAHRRGSRRLRGHGRRAHRVRLELDLGQCWVELNVQQRRETPEPPAPRPAAKAPPSTLPSNWSRADWHSPRRPRPVLQAAAQQFDAHLSVSAPTQLDPTTAISQVSSALSQGAKGIAIADIPPRRGRAS